MAGRPRLPEPCRLWIRVSATRCSRLLPSELASLVLVSGDLCLLRSDPIHPVKSQPISTAMEYLIWQLSPAIILSEAALTPSQLSTAMEMGHSELDRRFNLLGCRITHS